ncbi:hypothetical protein [Nannocystis punicea]|uniref:Uncharacterized protein n=1 Tax=Nannocystis punicea TaxID=2995304 RepID=A0ABY7GXN1_9BACT|nr:hypothetical protein [Nannocystis poenicansa]WAS91737.1 hypothetical protein O0S08_36610 [Nannocystis poenicansa]
MNAKIWTTPIRATNFRANELRSIRYETGSVSVHLLEEDTENTWKLSFTQIQAVRVTTWESAGALLQALPVAGGFFELEDSDLCRALGAGDRHYMKNSRHFLICCYDEIVEIVAHQVDVSLQLTE